MKYTLYLIMTIMLSQPLMAKEHWLQSLLKDNTQHLLKHPDVNHKFIAIEENLSQIERSKVRWNPTLNLSADTSEDQRVSINKTDGQGLVTDDGRTLSSRLQKRFESGTDLNLNVSQNESSSTSANRFSNDLTNTSISFTVSQALLKGNQKKYNLFELNQAEFNKLESDDAFQAALEKQLLNYAQKMLELSHALNDIQIRRKHANLSISERNRAKAKVRSHLAAKRTLLSHERNVLNQEIQLKEIERKIISIKKEMKIIWPELKLPNDKTLLGLLTRDLSTLVANNSSFENTRDGKLWERRNHFDSWRLKTMRHRKLDQLDLELNYRQRGTGTNPSDSWNTFGDGDSRRWSLGLVYQRDLGHNNDRLNYLSAKLQAQKNDYAFQTAKRSWNQSLIQIQEEAKNTKASLKEKKMLLAIYQQERELSHVELKQGLARLEEVFSVDRNLLNVELNILNDQRKLMDIDLRLRNHFQTILDLIP